MMEANKTSARGGLDITGRTESVTLLKVLDSKSTAHAYPTDAEAEALKARACGLGSGLQDPRAGP